MAGSEITGSSASVCVEGSGNLTARAKRFNHHSVKKKNICGKEDGESKIPNSLTFLKSVTRAVCARLFAFLPNRGV